jgi:hypothetical protein
MTSEERERMNRLCVGIQEETDYNKFAVLLHEMSDLIALKEQRRFEHHPKLVWQKNKPWKTLQAVVTKVVKPVLDGQPAKVEISIGQADDLFREVRIENNFTDVDGGSVALTNGARLDLTFEAEIKKTG